MLRNDRSKADIICSLLQQTSGDSLIALLNARLRWKLLTELCLGHARIKNGRSRDYPFFTARSLNTKLSLHFIRERKAFYPGINSEKIVTFTQYDMLVSLVLLELSEQKSFPLNSLAEEEHYSIALNVLVNELFSDSETTEKDRISRLLGISGLGEDATRASSQYKKDYIRFAHVITALSTHHQALQGLTKSEAKAFLVEEYQLRPKDIARLNDLAIDLIVIKTKQVQTFIDRCKLPFIQRGASYWCSQILARCRNKVEAIHNKRSLILTDCDSVSIQAVGEAREAEQIKELLEAEFTDPVLKTRISEQFIANLYPRLLPYYREAKQQQLNTVEALPNLDIDRRHYSLFDFIVERSALSDFCLETSKGLESLRFQSKPFHEGNCSGRHGDTTFKNKPFAIPSWFNKRKGEAYGWPSTVYSLVGMSYKQVTNSVITQTLSELVKKDIQVPRSHKELLSSGTTKQANLAYIKLDGDGVGKMFTSLSPIHRPSLSIRVETFIRQCWITTMANLITQYQLDLLPADLLYFGGDDLFCVLPEAYLESFLKVFDEEVKIQNKQHQLELSFSYACILLNIQYKREEPYIFPIVNQLVSWVKNDSLPESKHICNHEVDITITKQHKTTYLQGVIAKTIVNG